jgi:hypothetical protein
MVLRRTLDLQSRLYWAEIYTYDLDNIRKFRRHCIQLEAYFGFGVLVRCILLRGI